MKAWEKGIAALALLKYFYVEVEPSGNFLDSSLFGYVYDIETTRDQLTEI